MATALPSGLYDAVFEAHLQRQAREAKECPRCTEEATKSCGRCRSISYCSIECQSADFPTHKVLCKSFRDFEHRPSENMRRIVVFLPDEESPRFIWAPCENGTIEQPSFAKDATSSMNISRNAWTGTCLPVTISLRYDDNFMARYPTSNRAVILATNKKSLFDWRGPLVAFCGFSDLRGDIVGVKDMDMRTFSDLAAFFIDSYNRTREHALRKGPKVDCVKINCNGERRVNSVPRYEVVKVPASHPVFDGEGSRSQIATRTEMPLLTWQYPQGQAAWRKKYVVGDSDNQQVTFMHMGCDPYELFDPSKGTGSFGWAPMQHQDNVGNVLVASPLRKAKSRDIIHAFGDYCRHYLADLFQDAMEAEAEERITAGRDGVIKHKQGVLDEITQKRWQQWLSLWRRRRPETVLSLKRWVAIPRRRLCSR